MPNANVEQTLLLQLKSLPRPYTHSKLINYVSRQMQVNEDAAKLMLDNSMIYSVRSDFVVCHGSVHGYLKKQRALAMKRSHEHSKNQKNDNDKVDEHEHDDGRCEAKVHASIELVKLQSKRFQIQM